SDRSSIALAMGSGVTSINPGLVTSFLTYDLIKERAKQNICTYSLEAIDIAEAVIYVLEGQLE
ncbi:hypothetical protein, partial [Klebsiella aerogenes]|uniref:hypothetical protein n=1 Tax=Klebsiella aerogenes TaxID=548 RepID=UPI0019548A8C